MFPKGPAYTREDLNKASTIDKVQMPWIYSSLFYSNLDQMDYINKQAIISYNTAFERYSFARSERPDTVGEPPIPGYAVVVIGDGSSWTELTLSSDRVCLAKVYKPTDKPKLGKWLIGPAYYPNNKNNIFYMCLPGDITENGEEEDAVTSEGIMGRFRKSANIQSSPGVHDIPGVFIKVR